MIRQPEDRPREAISCAAMGFPGSGGDSARDLARVWRAFSR
jgi:hypothetical protein